MIPTIVLGAGLIGARHITHVQRHPAFELVGVVEPDTARPLPEGVTRLDRIGDAALAIIATPTVTHRDLATACLEAGISVLVEKPVTESAADALALDRLAKERGLFGLAGYHRRHHGAVQALRAALPKIGRPVAASLIWGVKKPQDYFNVPWRSGAGGSPVMINLVHDLDFLQSLFGPITDVRGHLTAATANRPCLGTLSLRFRDVQASVLFTDCAASPWGFEAGTGENPNIATSGADFLHILGTEGSIAFPSLRLFAGSADWSEPQSVQHLAKDLSRHPLDAQLDHLSDVAKGAPPLVTLADAARVLEVTEKIAALMEETDGGTDRG